MSTKKQKSRIVGVLGKIVRNNVGVTLMLFIIIAAAIVVGVLPPLVLEKIVNALAERKPIELNQVIKYFVLLAMAGILDSAREVFITIFGQKMTHGLRSEMTEKLSKLPASYYTRQESGVTVSRFVNDVNAVDALFSSGVISMIIDAGKIISILVVIFTRSLGLGILVLILMPAIYALTRLFQKRMLAAQIENRVAVGEANSQIPETVRNIRVIRLLHAQKHMINRYGDSIEKSFRAQEKSIFYDSIYSPIIITTSTFVVAVMMIASTQSGAFRIFFGISVGTAVAMISYVGKIFDPLENIGMEIQNIQSAVAGVRRVSEFLSEEEMKDLGKKSATTPNIAVAMKDVHFTYSDEEHKILNGINLEVRSGEQITLTGRTGAGKSTIFKLLLGLYPPQSGTVEIFGRKPEQILDSEKRITYGYVEQQFHEIPGSIADQISMGDDSVTRDEIRKSLEFVGLLSSIEKLENGIDTPFSARLFSQGQIQLLSIARAVVKNPKLMLMDEITANLDSSTERQVLTALENAAKNRTVLSISHRLFEKNGMKQFHIGA